MSWITIIWSMIASACFTLAAIHLLTWLKRRTAWANLLFSLTATATAGLAFCELWMMRAETTGEFGRALQWLHVPGLIVIVTLVLFVRLYLRAGRTWLGWAICVSRTLSLILNFAMPPNLNYREITALRHVPFLGEFVSAGQGVPNPWMLVGQASFLLLIVYVADAARTVWRRGDPWQARFLIAAILFFFTATTVQAILALWEIVFMPMTISLFYLGIVVAMGFELSSGVLRAAQLADDLRESEARLALAADSADAGLWSWDFKTNRIWATEKARGLYGFLSDRTITFERLLDAVHPEDRGRVGRDARQAFQEGSDFHSEYRIVLPDGSIRWIKAQAQAHLKPSGEPDRMMGVSLDVSERKRDEGEMVQLRLELAHLARVTTMNEMSTSLAHEINQPLGAILNNASTANILLSQMKDPDEELIGISQDIIQDARRAGDVVRKIRGMVRKGDVQLEPLRVNALIEDVVELFHAGISMNNISVRLDLKSNLAKIRGDRVRLQQVLLNLITNALEAMKEEHSKILTIRSAMHAPSDMVIVSVSDSGTGIDEAKMAAVFKPFFTTKQDGLGLGLAVCRSIIEEHGGRIWAENGPGGGATFSFSLKAFRGEST
jgi:two-component system sensor kinase FixL